MDRVLGLLDCLADYFWSFVWGFGEVLLCIHHNQIGVLDSVGLINGVFYFNVKSQGTYIDLHGVRA
jgi:hypothetical protein